MTSQRQRLVRHDTTSLERRVAILDLLAEGPHSAPDLAAKLPTQPSVRTLFDDLKWLAGRFPEQVVRESGQDARQVFWRLIGLPPILLPHAIDILTHDELAAVIAARGFLRAPDARSPGWERPATAYAGDLSSALHGLLERSGLTAEAKAIAPTTIGVSRFGIAPEAPGALAALERALRTRQATRFRYRNRGGDERDLHVWPIRLVLIKGEWFCFAWSPASPGRTSPGRVKQYALSRITSRDPAVRIEARLPPGAPVRPPHAEVDASLASGFHATGGGERRRVVLAVSPDAWPFITDRTWGESQALDATPADLPPGWRRIAFSTTGLEECRHWVMSFGSAVRAEGPAELREWLKKQAKDLLASLESDSTPISASPVAEIGDTLENHERGI